MIKEIMGWMPLIIFMSILIVIVIMAWRHYKYLKSKQK